MQMKPRLGFNCNIITICEYWVVWLFMVYNGNNNDNDENYFDGNFLVLNAIML